MRSTVQEPAPPTGWTTWQALENSVRLHTSREAVVYGDTRVTYAGLLDKVERLATGLLAAGIQPGDHVAFLMPSIPEWVYLHYALATIGAIAVPVNYMYRGDELRWVLRQADVTAIVTADGLAGVSFLELLEGIDSGLQPGEVHSEQFPLIKSMFVLDTKGEQGGAYSFRTLLSHEPSEAERARLAEVRSRVSPDDACFIIFTSGSTARPKPALVPHRAVCGAGHYFTRALQVTHDDRYLHMLPTFHIGGASCGIATPHAVGATMVTVGVFEPGLVLETIERERCTVTGGFDTHFAKIMAHPEFKTRDISSLRSSWAGCTPAFRVQLKKALKFEILTVSYGCTESAALCAISMPEDIDPEVLRNSNGRVLPGVEMRIIDPETGKPVAPGTLGEICFRGWNRFLGYYNMPEETAAALDAEGFLHMGDYGWLDEDNNIYYRGRYKMMIKTGGENVSEKEVEIFLEDNIPAVEFAQVVGVPDDVWGEAVVAFVQLKAGMISLPEEIRAQCRGKIAGFKIPKHVFILEAKDWPMLAVGRPDKHTLRKMAAERLGRVAPA
ncbi:MAG: hypothetical protein EPO21_18185 [Chloroflexota bacterium]|nr:MAG: hypothetical protein EPO21_18185 [Chloroflexota bacterium]